MGRGHDTQREDAIGICDLQHGLYLQNSMLQEPGAMPARKGCSSHMGSQSSGCSHDRRGSAHRETSGGGAQRACFWGALSVRQASSVAQPVRFEWLGDQWHPGLALGQSSMPSVACHASFFQWNAQVPIACCSCTLHFTRSLMLM